MASNRDLKLKSHLEEEYGATVEEAFTNGQKEKTNHYRAILLMYRQYNEAMLEKHNAELEVYRLTGKLQLFEELFNGGVMVEVKEKLERELELAEAALSDVKVPTLNWEKLGEPIMWRSL